MPAGRDVTLDDIKARPRAGGEARASPTRRPGFIECAPPDALAPRTLATPRNRGQTADPTDPTPATPPRANHDPTQPRPDAKPCPTQRQRQLPAPTTPRNRDPPQPEPLATRSRNSNACSPRQARRANSEPVTLPADAPPATPHPQPPTARRAIQPTHTARSTRHCAIRHAARAALSTRRAPRPTPALIAPPQTHATPDPTPLQTPRHSRPPRHPRPAEPPPSAARHLPLRVGASGVRWLERGRLFGRREWHGIAVCGHSSAQKPIPRAREMRNRAKPGP